MNPDTKPAYLFASAQICPNEAAAMLLRRKAEIDRQARELDKAYVGALFASLFARHPWLASLTLNITAEFEYDDSGGYYRTFSTSFGDVAVIEDVQLPEDVSAEGVLDEDLAAYYLGVQLENHEGDIYVVFHGEDTGTLPLRIERSRLATLLDADVVNGADAFRALFATVC